MKPLEQAKNKLKEVLGGKKDELKEADVFHTPGGEMPDPNERQGDTREDVEAAFTEEDAKDTFTEEGGAAAQEPGDVADRAEDEIEKTKRTA